MYKNGGSEFSRSLISFLNLWLSSSDEFLGVEIFAPLDSSHSKNHFEWSLATSILLSSLEFGLSKSGLFTIFFTKFSNIDFRILKSKKSILNSKKRLQIFLKTVSLKISKTKQN